jgi:2-dehydro-3-deoxyphosphogluconate aldolase/(4S)-4-hydroxy-2-oxoglutarate aldolase
MRERIAHRIKTNKIVAIIRMKTAFDILPLTEALLKGGIDIIEVTMNTVDPLDCIEKMVKHFSADQLLIGAGTILTEKDVEHAINSGAKFIVTPATPGGIISTAHHFDAVVLAGAYTPLEILNVYTEGAEFIKLFPADIMGIPYLKALKGPFSHIDFIPTGGITIQNISLWLNAGACALGVGSSLVNEELVKQKKWNAITSNAKQFRNALDQFNAKGEM